MNFKKILFIIIFILCLPIIKVKASYNESSILYGNTCYQLIIDQHEIDNISPYKLSRLNDWKSIDSPITREEAITYIIQSYGVIPFDEFNYIWNDEKDQSLSYHNYIDFAYRLHITLGTGNNCFSPKEYITISDFKKLLKNTKVVENQLIPKYEMQYDSELCKVISAKYQLAISNLPDDIVDFFYNQKWEYRIMEYPYTKNNVLGVTSYKEKEIIQIGWYGKAILKPNLMDTTYHEFGHFIQYFTEIDASNVMSQEMDKLSTITGSYCKTDPDEYFAEAFSIYIKNPYVLKHICPNSYKLIDEALIIFRNII